MFQHQLLVTHALTYITDNNSSPLHHPTTLVFLAATRWKLQLHVFKHPLETLRKIVLTRTTLPPWDINLCLLKFIIVIQHLSMTYQSHHCPAKLLYSACINVFLLTSSCTLCSVRHIRSMCYSSPLHFLTLFMLYSSLHTTQLVLQRNNILPLSQHISFIHALIIRYTLHLQRSM